MANKALTGFALAFVSAVITSIILPVWSTPVLHTDPSPQKINPSLGEDFEITCFALSDGDVEITSMQWSFRNRTIVSGKNKQTYPWENQLTLKISNIALVHRGTYQCSALYNINQTVKTEVYIKVNREKPYFLNTREVGSVAEFSNYSLTCHAYGAYPIEYTWMEGYNYISKNDDRRSISETSFSSTLNFYRITKRAYGSYSCIASNAPEKFAKKAYWLEVTEPNEGDEPTFQSNYETITVTELSNLEILCQANGTAFMNYKWYDQNELEIPRYSTSSPYISETTNGSLLIVTKITAAQAGSYMCSAINGYGLTSKVYRVDVVKGNGTTEQMLDIEEIEVTEVTTNSVTFGIPPQRKFDFIDVFYIVHRGSKSFRESVRWDQEDSFTMKDLIPSATYVFDFELFVPNIPIFTKSVSVTLLPPVPDVSLMYLNSGSAKLRIIRSFRSAVDMHQVSYQLISYNNNKFERTGCKITTVVPACHGETYAITGLLSGNFYEISVRAHTKAGFGEPSKQTVFIS